MQIQQLDRTFRDLVAGYRDDGWGDASGCGGKPDIRPPLQHDYIYQMCNREKSLT